MKRMHSIRTRLTLFLLIIMAATVIVTWAVNRGFIVRYYVRNEQKELVRSYKLFDSKLTDPATSLREVLLIAEQVDTNTNMNIMILKKSFAGFDYVPIYPEQGFATSKISYSSLINMIDSLDDDNAEPQREALKAKGYFITQNVDQELKGQYLDLFGMIDNDDYIILLRSPFAIIQTASTVASRLFTYVSVFSTALGAVAMFYVSRRFSKPIQEMAMVAEQMTNLDFDARVETLSNDEIGHLAHSINSLSEKLQTTISELKTANNELQKDLERKTEIDEMRKEFLAHVSHELKTPIALIQGYAEGLKDNVNDDSEGREFYCDVITDEAHKMNNMVKKLLTLNQIEFGQNQIHMERFDIVDMIKNLIISGDILYKKLNATIVMEQEQPIYVWADEYMIEEVMSNYLSNARNHLSKDGTIMISFEQKETEVKVSVKNTGFPIPEEDINKVWGKFYKVDKARTREYGGSGVGLSIVAAIMEAHGKSYGVFNEEDGVTFYITLDTNISMT